MMVFLLHAIALFDDCVDKYPYLKRKVNGRAIIV